MPAAAIQPAHPDAQAVLEFWLRDGLQAGWPTESLGWLWFGGGAQLDQDIDARFGHLVRDAAAGALADWESSALDRLALLDPTLGHELGQMLFDAASFHVKHEGEIDVGPVQETVGGQLIAPHFDEARMFGAAYALEKALGVEATR